MNDKNYKLKENIDIDELADMAHIALSQEEKQQIEKEICDFIEFAACLEAYSEPKDSQRCISLDELREDIAMPSEDSEAITALSKSFVAADGLFCAPRAISVKEANE